MKKEENKCNSEEQFRIDMELYMVYYKCVVRLWQLSVKWDSVLLILLEVESNILPVFFILLSQLLTIILMLDTTFWKACPLKSSTRSDRKPV